MGHHRIYAVLLAVLLLVVIGRIVAVFTLYVHADEFVLLQRAVITQRTGALVGGGRPGLATLLLTPFAAACRNAVDTMVQARLLWTAVTAAMAVAFWALLRSALSGTRWRPVALATAVGLWVLSPPFLYASTQVRTDQPAILFGLLGGTALLASRRRAGWAAVAGLLFGVGFLFSQKLLYVGGLVTVLTAGQLALRVEWHARREVLRVAVAGGVFVLTVLGYRQLMGALATAPTLLPVAAGLSSFDFYRESVGWRYYQRMLPVLVPQVFVILGLVVLTLAWFRDRGRHTVELVVAWSVVAVGIVVLLFHAGRFSYFYMVLGLYPAAVGGLIAGPILDRLRSPRSRAFVLALVWLPLSVFGLLQAAVLTIPQQQQQRASLDWVERNFSLAASGFNNWGAFACRNDPFPIQFGAQIRAAFSGERREQRVRELLQEFRDRPVAFLIPPIESGYPEELREFWRTRYVHYYGGIHVPGRQVRGGPEWTGAFEVIVPGEYAWRAAATGSNPLEVEGHSLQPGSSILLSEQRLYSLALPEGGDGLLVLALPEPPERDTVEFFVGY